MKHFRHVFFFVLISFTVTVKSQVITTVVGNGIGGHSGDGGPATSAQINPQGPIYVDASHNIFFSEYNSRIRKVNGSTGIITTIAGTSVPGYSGDGGPATSAQLNEPFGIYEDAAGNIYIGTIGDFRIRKINTSGIISTIAGTGVEGYSGDGGAAKSAAIGYVQGITGDAFGNIYFTDYGFNSVVRKINASGIISTIAGKGIEGHSGDGGLATAAELSAPNSISFDAAGNYYIGCDGLNSVRKINTSKIISTVAGSGSSVKGNSGDGGAATSAHFCDIECAITDASGNIYIADACNNKVRKVNASTRIITTIAGTGTAGYTGDGGPATSATLDRPWGLSISNGDLYISDDDNHVIRKISSNTTTPSSSITISNIIKNNTTIPLPRILWSGTTSQTPDIIKICADASNATEFTFVNNTSINSNNIRFWVASDPSGNNSDVSGYFILDKDNYSINGNTIKAKFTHPKYLESIYKPFRSDAIHIVDYTNPNTPIFSIPVQIYRAPVLMVHGFWGNIESFFEMEKQLDLSGFFPPELTFNVDYFATNGAYFYDNRNVVPSNINTLLSILRNQGYSAGKVDVISHSMGGLISRYYLQSTDYQQKNDIHKLITINTPHSGSPLGNLLTNISKTESDAARIVAEPIANKLFYSSIYNGAISDLAINSNGMYFLNSATLNKEKVPSHAIITKSIVSDDNVYYLILAAAAPIAAMSVKAYTDYLFYGDLNDLVVSVPSQSGGLPSSATTTFPNQWHIGSPANSDVINEVIKALNISSSDASYFTQDGFAPININTHYRPAQSSESLHLLSGSLNVSFPIRNQSFKPGDLIPVNINSSNGINRIIIEAINTINNSFILDTLMSSGIINYTVPSNAFGQVKFMTLGYNSSKLIDYDTLSININQTSTLDSIAFFYDTLYTQVNNTTSISTRAYFKNGYNYIINNLNGLQYQIADTDIAKLSILNQIQGKRIGNTILTATYLGQSKIIAVVVLPQDSSVNMELPITLIISFSGQSKTSYNELKWQTVEGNYFSYFNLQKSVDNIQWTDIAKINGTLNSSIHDYQFNDSSFTQQSVIYYRLLMYNKDGTYTTSNIVVISRDANVSRIRVFPNPVTKHEVFVDLGSFASATTIMKVIDLSGKIVKKINPTVPTTNPIRLNLLGLKPSIYVLQIQQGSDIKTIKLVVIE